MSEEERFWAKVIVTPGCWLWTAATSGNGYGSFCRDRQHGHVRISAHRWAWEQARGIAPAGMVLDHLCRTRRCVNPAHLELVTNAENIRRGWTMRGATKDRCNKGHARVDWERCRRCNVEQVTRWRAAKTVSPTE